MKWFWLVRCVNIWSGKRICLHTQEPWASQRLIISHSYIRKWRTREKEWVSPITFSPQLLPNQSALNDHKLLLSMLQIILGNWVNLRPLVWWSDTVTRIYSAHINWFSEYSANILNFSWCFYVGPLFSSTYVFIFFSLFSVRASIIKAVSWLYAKMNKKKREKRGGL